MIERYYTILSKKPKTEAGKQQLAIYELCTELTYYWVFFNLPPKTYNGVKYMLQCDFKEIEKLKRTAVSKRNDKWNSDCGRIIDKLNDGYDIRSSNAEAIALMKDNYGVDVTKDEEEFYRDNCVIEGVNGSGERKRWCGGVDTAWWKEAKKEETKWSAVSILQS